MLDFTSALYLGFRHETRSLEPWSELTTGAPAALTEPPGARDIGRALGELVGVASGILVTSTLHLFWDLFTSGFAARRTIFFDEALYPIARWGIERAVGRGIGAHSFSHHEPERLRSALRRNRPGHLAVVVTDGFCPGCGRSAPLPQYLDLLRPQGGCLVVDDTQALGVFGTSPEPGASFGRGGGGSLRRLGVGGHDVLVGASLAKGFGVPTAVLAGEETMIRRFEGRSETRVHCSPPCAVDTRAAAHALALNAVRGDERRRHLGQLVARFRNRLGQAGFSATGGLFPVQRLETVAAPEIHRRLLAAGVKTVLQKAACRPTPGVAFVLTAMHQPLDIDRAVRSLCDALEATKQTRQAAGRTSLSSTLG